MASPADRHRIAAVVVAAGRGERFGAPKHRLEIEGDELWRRSVDVFASIGLAQLIVVGDVPGGVPGGRRRRDSVYAGIAELDGVEFVLIHDAARPLVTRALVLRVIDRLTRGDVDGVIPAVPLSDTIKQISGEDVVDTVDRSTVVAVQTPQGFRLTTLRDAHERNAEQDATDDAQLVELMGGRVVTVPGEAENLKITYPADLELARWLTARRSEADD